MGDVAGSVGPVDRLNGGDGRVKLPEHLFEVAYELIERGALAEGRVVNLVYGLLIVSGYGEHIHLYHIINICEVARILAIAVDSGRFVAHQFLDEERYHCRISAVGVLAAAEDIEVSQTYVLKVAICASEDIGIKLIYVFGDGVGR